ncbi:6043_t:CDS:2 [Dentiscutata heterogama]|nr:6043_t:CDS:2 [Dentiscutata heterogama]
MSHSPGDALNDIYILDTLKFTWTQGSNVNAPTSRGDFTATLINNGLILYLGGDNINIFKITGGDEISPRIFHSAVLSPDGHVILYGGKGPTDQNELLASLDTTVNPYKWSAKPMIEKKTN